MAPIHIDDPVLNCLLAVCCPPERAEATLAKVFVSEGADEKSAAKCAEVVMANFDLAPAGSLLLFKEGIARLARGADYKG